MMGIKTIILGIDGATWDVLKYQVDQGNLPTIRELMDKGVWGSLESCIPPVTAPAWTSIATGKNPGKTGVFDFFNRDDKNNLSTKALTSQQIRRARPFWDILSENTYKVGIWNYPFLFPPYKLNGFMVSGLGSSPEDAFCYPETLKHELYSVVDIYKIEIPHASKKYLDNEMLFVNDISKLLMNNEKIIEFLLRNKDVNLFFGVISALDFMQHYLWKYIDTHHPFYDKNNVYRDEFTHLLNQLDSLIGKIRILAPSDTNIMLVSDHGFGPHHSSFCINQFLYEKQFLKKIGRINYLFQLVAKSPEILRHLPQIIQRKQLPEDIHFEKIDMENSVALSINSVGSGGISLNPLSIQDSNEYQRIRNTVVTTLEDTCRSLGIKCEIFLPENIYTGELTNLAPDILFILDGLATSVNRRFTKLRTGFFIKDSPPSNHTGEHRMNGIFLASGPDFKAGSTIDGAKLFDIAPTILHMFDVPIPSDMDGRILTEIFRDDSEIAQRTPMVVNPAYYDKKLESEKLKSIIKKLKI